MIRFTSDDLARAAESLSYQQVVSGGISRSIDSLPEDSIVKLSSITRATEMDQTQFEIADGLGRYMAKVAQGGQISQILGAGAKAIQKSVGLERIRGASKAYSRQEKALRKVKGKKRRVSYTRTKKFEPGFQAFKERWKDKPVQVTKAVAKDVAPWAGAGYLGAKALGGSRDR